MASPLEQSTPGPAPGSGLGNGAAAHAGIDPDGVAAWMGAHVPEAVGPFTFSLFAGGRSNLTYQVDDAAGHSYVLRRPPVSHVLATAHDMGREYRVMTALAPTDVPVPKTYGICDDPSVTGAPFYVMARVEGPILRDASTAEASFDLANRGKIGDHMADTLAALHAVRPDDVGLGDLGRKEGYIERQLRRWSGQYQQMAVAGVDHGHLIEDTGIALAESNPGAGRSSATATASATIVHGDYRLDNVVLGSDGTVAAVLDWEICTLGEPMADVGLLMVYWSERDDGEPFLGDAPPTFASGFAGRDEVLTRYAERSGRDVSDVRYYMAFGYWKLACILQGVYARYVAGARAGDPASVDSFPKTVDRLAKLAADTLEAHRSDQ